MRIYVSKGDIAKGVAGYCKECPIALAINRRLKHGYIASVSQCSIQIIGPNLLKVYDIHNIAVRLKDFIGNFDKTFKADPASFSIPIPLRYLKINKEAYIKQRHRKPRC